MSYGDRSELIEDLVHCGRMITERNQEIGNLQVEICELKDALMIKPDVCEHKLLASCDIGEVTSIVCNLCDKEFDTA